MHCTEQRLEKTDGQSSMDNPDINNTGYTIHRKKTNKRESTAQKTLTKMSNTDPTKNRG